MPVPFETLIPYGIMIAVRAISMLMFGITGTGLHVIKGIQNGGKKPRWGLDQWDRVMMDRDRRLTGDLRGQIGNHEAPPGFELNNPWRLEKRIS
ncbi:Small secreted protein [Colletotrichum higginsianum IMI 349063]|uniref:NADH dehydrogenase [ubiquinone] 1 alpha subcomplex subunit 1 n=1 Tax=Colletotrichum higginsianum (strain IMI 349063) TaxID=759273 RepID=A0A1B7YFI2_COLHI|nr:Small secreted protein [Colletotrichum higginsianum IMI 349063]OBR10700.1 Small secreted protein [Colletotrichum higginsianum IMI 349063]